MLTLLAALTLSSVQHARIDDIVATVMRDQHVSSVSLGIARGDGAPFVRGYNANGNSTYRIGSIGKQFTAALALQDVQSGRLSLDAPASRYDPDLPSGRAGSLTIAQLLSQTGGLAPYDDAPLGAAWDAFLARPFAVASGTGWAYSNANYAILGQVLERTNGVPYARLLQSRILQPLDLAATTYDAASPELITGGAMISNVPDLLRWLGALRTGKVVDAASFARMTSSAKLADGTPAGYGFGFFTGNWYGYRVAFHGGNLPGFSGVDAMVLDDGLEVAILSNGDRADLIPLAKSVVRIVDAPRDPNLDATISQGAENEDPRVTGAVRTIATSPAFAWLGSVRSIEFIERNQRYGESFDMYRVTFDAGRWRAVVSYHDPAKIESFAFQREDE